MKNYVVLGCEKTKPIKPNFDLDDDLLLGIPISDTGVEDKSRLAVFVLALEYIQS